MRSAAFIRLCHPGPSALKRSSTSPSMRREIDCLRFGASGRPQYPMGRDGQIVRVGNAHTNDFERLADLVVDGYRTSHPRYDAELRAELAEAARLEGRLRASLRRLGYEI